MGSTCKVSIAVGASCSISVVFKPKSAGHFTGLITIADSASTKPQFIELQGSATVLKLSPGSLNFGDQKVGTRSAPQAVTVTNEGSTAVQFGSVYVGGKNKKDFSEANSCTGSPLQPGASCQVAVTFDPTASGARSGDLYVLPKSTVSPVPVALSGTGT
jgi:hypothetical protein